jgi:ABC-type polysaccharide/polyol phosphate transport system ATPase subunit
MSDIALRMDQVYKKFRRGETFNSLRDLIPALTGRMFRQQELSGHDRREFWALQDISFEVKRGEAFGIIGHNGAGKSTVLKILSRIMKPTKGRMVVNGRMSALIEVAAGFHQDLTGRENIYLHGTILGMSKSEIASKFDQMVAFSGLEEFIDTPVKRYSSGMYARLGFSVAAHVDPEVMIVDEVLSVGDYVFQNKCLERMKEVIRGGTSVLFVSHNLKSVAEFCHQCMLLEKGRMVTTGPAEEVVSTYLNEARNRHIADASSRQIAISKVTVRGEHGESARFQSGQKAWIDVEVTARTSCSKLSVTLYITDDNLENIFDTSTERLTHDHFTMAQGDVFMCTFELYLNMVTGVYHPSILVYRYDTQTKYDEWEPATTIYVSSGEDVRGTVNCFPRIVQQEIRAASEANLARARRDASSGGVSDAD